MKRLIYLTGMARSRRALIRKYGNEFWKRFRRTSGKTFTHVSREIPPIGKSIFRFNYYFLPSYIAWYKAFEQLGVGKDEIDENIWLMNERLLSLIPGVLLQWVGATYFKGFGKKAAAHIEREKKGLLRPYDWQIEYRPIDDNCFELDISRCPYVTMSRRFGAAGLVPGICRVDYLMANMMGNGFERTKTLGDGDDRCNPRYCIKGDCEWAPEKGFVNRK